MNEQANEALANLLQLAVDGVEGAVEFSKAQIPDVVEQLLMWHMLESLIVTFTPLIFVIIFGSVSLWCCNNLDNFHEKAKKIDPNHSPEKDMIPVEFVCLGAMVCTAASTLVFLLSMNTTWLKILVAPKLYLLEYAAELVK